MFVLVIFVQLSGMPVGTASQFAAGVSPGVEYSVSSGWCADEIQGDEQQQQQPESTRHDDDDVNDVANDASDTS